MNSGREQQPTPGEWTTTTFGRGGPVQSRIVADFMAPVVVS